MIDRVICSQVWVGGFDVLEKSVLDIGFMVLIDLVLLIVVVIQGFVQFYGFMFNFRC